jgi:ribosomal protein S18 acetylase RimI-like enzyme
MIVQEILALEAAHPEVGQGLALKITEGRPVSLLTEFRGGHVAAYLAYQVEGNEAHVLRVLTAKPWQRQGLARKLLLSVMAQHERVTLETGVNNHPATRLYESLGFTFDRLLPEGFCRLVWVTPS